jgi:hypothetical protein
MLLIQRKGTLVLALGAVFCSAHAVVIDGTADGSYGSALFTQSNATGFGDSNLGSLDLANGSELDGVFGLLDSNALDLVATGNVESNFNHEVFFIDTGTGGFNTIGADNASSDDFGFLNSLAGTKFDTGFNASYAVWVRNGNDGSDTEPNTMFVTVAKLGAAGSDLLKLNAGGTAGTIRTVTDAGGFAAALNNSNTGGVTGSSGSGAGVTTGFEFNLPVSIFGSTSSVKVAGFILGGTFLSNQVIGGLPAGTGNLGNAAPTDFSAIAGNQFVTINATPAPEPGTVAALGLGALFILRRRRSK